MSLRSGRQGSLRLALLVVVGCALLLGIIQIAVGLGVPDNLWAVVVFTAAFWVWVAAGVTAWWRRPNNATGALIVIGGITVLLGGLVNLGIELLSVISAVFATSVLAVVVHLLHAFPSGRLHGRLSIAVVIGSYGVSVVLQALSIAIRGDRAAISALTTVQSTLGIALMVITVIILVGRLRAADHAHRKVLAPLFLYGSLAVLLIPAAPLVVRALGEPQAVSGVIQLALLAGLPIAFLLGVLFGGFRRTGELEALAAWLGLSGAPRSTVERALASTMGDDSLQVVYWSPDRSAFVDGLGMPVDDARGDAGRTWLEVSVESRLVGAIVYDNRMIADTDVVRRAGEVLAIAIDRERLTAELLASNDALLQSRLRLVETADRERSRIAQDLHDGLQVQLVLLALEAQQIGNAPDASVATSRAATELRRRIDEAAAELRRLVHNVLPAALVERGLSAAAEDLVDRLAIPATLEADVDDDSLAPATTHTAYLIIAEALTNAVKHSHATSVRVTIGQVGARLHLEIADNGIGGASYGNGAGTGIKGLADRVDVLGGIFALESVNGQGTRMRVELPCGS
ncbi:Histidine kinase-, DNA gyrase B-, and HSP90-like ATPase [Herbiconiux ginsengi]|uniref:Oxygen sensor histidine kinase NreB n=2 Tax=Herbiconiux ginsengi TaxID=381665 RepID=A0A1H3RF35_9MICO|nr:Histidine kinase-, DNA gyrase B-, and HSP90-like ATPase [Herbiconiux ginsengi]